MITRSGAMYKSETEGGREKGAADEDAARTGATDAEAAPLTDLVRMLMEDRRRRDEEMADEQRRRELEASRQEEVLREQMDIIRRLVETSGARSDARAGEGGGGVRTGSRRGQVVLTKFVEGDDVEAYLTTFQRLMTVHRVDRTLWMVHLAPQLAGRAH